ncbi:hypothetical protein TIFTF001_054802, partial [Ficus carica]
MDLLHVRRSVVRGDIGAPVVDLQCEPQIFAGSNSTPPSFSGRSGGFRSRRLRPSPLFSCRGDLDLAGKLVIDCKTTVRA